MPNFIKSATTISNGTIKRNNFLIGVNTSLEYGPNLTPGTKDELFNIGSGFTASVTAISIQSDGKILAGGAFSAFDGSSQNGLIRLNSNGSKDSTFDIGSGFNGQIYSSVIQSDGKILVGGAFTTFTGATQNRLIRLNSDGSKDSTFDIGSGFNNTLNAIAIQTDGKILTGGFFTTFTGTTQPRLIRLNSDGSKDSTFDIGSGFTSTVDSISIQTDGKILVGGRFTTFTGSTQNRLIRLNSNGSKDLTFNIGTGFNAQVNSVSIQSDGKIVVGGSFTTFTGSTQNKLIRLNSSGTQDLTFNIGTGFITGTIDTISIKSDGKVLVGGSFTTFTGSTQNRLIRLNSNGTQDLTFNIGNGFDGQVHSTVIQSNGTSIVGGSFTSFNLISQNYLIKLNTEGTGFWSGIIPPTSGYTVYAQKEYQGPSIRLAPTDSELIIIAKQYGGTNINTVNDALNFFNSQSQFMVTNIDYENIVTSGLTLLLDAGYIPSYSRSGTTWSDLSGNGYNANMTGGTVPFTAATASYFNYTNTPAFFVGNNNLISSITTGITISSWVKITDLTKRSCILDKYQTTAPFGYRLEVGTVGGVWTNTIRFYIQGSTALYGIDARGASNAVTQNVNCMITGTFDYPSRVCALYVNGASISFTNPNQTSLMGSDWSQSTNVYTVGSFRPEELIDSSMNQYNLIVYNRALSSTEVLQNYNAQKSRFGL